MEYNYETREAVHGLSYGAFAKIVKKDDTGVIDTTIKPTEYTGLRSCNFETSQESNSYFADNQTHIKLSGAKKIEGTITCYQFPKQFVLDHLGKKEMANGGLVDTGAFAGFIWQYITTITDEFGAETRELNIYYNVSASPPTGEDKTDEESTEPKEFEIPLNASPNSLVLDTDGKAVSYMQIRETAENKALIDLAYEQIILPTTPIPPEV